MQHLGELAQLARLLLLVLDLGSKRSAAEQPNRESSQSVGVTLGKLSGLLQSRSGVDRTAEHDGLDTAGVDGIVQGTRFGVSVGFSEPVRDDSAIPLVEPCLLA
jgi:hypothetical protein